MPQQFLRRLDVDASLPQHCGVSVAEAMKPYPFRDSDLLQRGPDVTLQDHVRGNRLTAVLCDRWKDEILIRPVKRDPPPLLHEPGALASALPHLERRAQGIAPAQMQPAVASLFIINPFSGVEAVSSLFSTHPPTRLRIARLEAMMSKSTQLRSCAA
jgi:hypothetical protein